MIVHTESGSTYEFDQDAKTVQRVRNDGRGQLRKDGEKIPLLRMEPPVLGERMVMLIDVRGDGVETLRTTTPVTAITVRDEQNPCMSWTEFAPNHAPRPTA